MKRPRRAKPNTTVDNLVHAVAHLQRDVALLQIAPLPADRDIAKEVAALVGAWIADQKASGQTTVDLKRVDDIRTGIELALT